MRFSRYTDRFIILCILFFQKVQKMPLGDIVTIDIDAQTLESPYDDLGQFPEDVVSALKHTLKKPSSATGETVARAFVSTFAALIGQYKSAFAVQTTEKTVDVSFVGNSLCIAWCNKEIVSSGVSL